MPELCSSELKLTAGGPEARGKQGESTLEVLGDRGGAERAVDDDQRVIDGELWRVGVLVVGGEVGDFREQQGDKGSLLAALDRSGRSWFALADDQRLEAEELVGGG